MIKARLKSNSVFFLHLLTFKHLKLHKPQPQTYDTHGSSLMNKGLIASLLLLLCANPKAGFALSFDDIMDKGVISIAVYRDFPPFSYRKKNKLQGVDVDIARTIADKLGVKLNLIEQSADENVDDDLRNAIWKGHYLGGQVADIMLHIPYDKQLEKRNELVVLFAPYYREEMVVARDIAKLGKDATLAHFRYEKIAVELDSLADLYLSGAFGGSIRNNILHYTTTEQAAHELVNHKAAGLMGTRSAVEGALVKHRQAYDIGTIPMPGLQKETWLLGLAVKNDYRQLGYAVGDIIGEMVTGGAMKTLFEKYGLTYTPPADGFYN